MPTLRELEQITGGAAAPSEGEPSHKPAFIAPPSVPSVRVPAPGYVRIERNDQHGVTVQLRDPATMSKGYGGWVEVPRPRDKALIEWQGHPSMQLQISVLFNGWTDSTEPWGSSIEAQLETLEDLTDKTPGEGQPPLLKIYSTIVPGTLKSWVLNDIEWSIGDDIRRPTDGHRVRSACLLTFVEYINEDLITSSAHKHKKKKNKKKIKIKGRKGTYIVREGDTLKSIARTQLGGAHRWKEIATLNHKRDSRSVRTGEHLRLP